MRSKRVPYGDYPPKKVQMKNGNSVILRLFKKSDLVGIWDNFNEAVAEKVYLPVYTPVLTDWERISWYHDIKDEGNICVVALDPAVETEEKVVGQLTIEHIPWEAAQHVGQIGIIVRKTHRNQGLGYHLIQYGAELARFIGKRKLILSTLASNTSAIHLYEKCGFTRVGIYKQQYLLNDKLCDELLMEWIFDG